MMTLTRGSIIFLSAAVLGLAQEYVISTFAGGAPPPTPVLGIDMPIAPQSVTTDALGNTYFVASNCVFKLDVNSVVTRIAGNGRPGYSGDGGPATDAQFQAQSVNSPGTYVYVGGNTLPPGITADNLGNVYVADNGNYRVRRISSDGIVTTVAGNGTAGFSGDGGPATDAQLSAVFGVALDVAGNLLIADSNANRIRRVTPDGTITTIAGTGDRGLEGDGGPAVAAQLRNPAGIAIDTAGNLFIADLGNARIRRVTPDGNITTVAGAGPIPAVKPGDNECQPSGDGGPAASAVLCLPINVAVDQGGKLFVADVYPNVDYYFTPSFQVVREISPTGVITTIAGSNCLLFEMPGGDCYKTPGYGTTATRTLFQGPLALAMDNAGNLVVADDAAGQVGLGQPPASHIYKLVSGGAMASLVGNGQISFFSGDGGQATNAQLRQPEGVAVDGGGNVFISDNLNYRIRRVSSSGIITTVAGNGNNASSGDGGPSTSAQAGPSGVAVDGAGNLFFFDVPGRSIRKIAPEGTISTVTGIGGYYGQSYDSLVGADRLGNVFAACSTGILDTVCETSPDGTTRTVAGNGTWGFSGDGGSATSAQLAHPGGVAKDSAGNLFIADTLNHRIRRITPDGIISTIAGNGATSPSPSSYSPGGFSGDGGPATNAQLSYPEAVAVDGAGNLFIADSGNYRVRKISPDKIITTVAGSGAVGYSGDGGIATRASFSGPIGLAVDGAGNIYVADVGNNAIRVLRPVPRFSRMPRE